MDYPFDGIQVNGREVSFGSILGSKEKPGTAFEKSTFEFIRYWYSQTDSFQFQTSGSTGLPRIISFSRAQIRRSAQRTIQALGMKRGDSVLVCLPTSFIAGKMMLVRAMEAGIKIIAAEPSSTPFEKIHQPIDFASLIPMQLQKILSDSESTSILNSMTGILIGGAPVSKLLNNMAQKTDSPLFETYGMTETISNIALRRMNGDNRVERFQPMKGVMIEKDNRGCLIIHDMETGIEVVTNDVANIRPDSSFTIMGRIDNIINTGAIKISPEYIEAKIEPVLTTRGIFNNFLLSSLDDDRLGQRVVLLIEGSFTGEKDELLGAIGSELSEYERPRELLVLENFQYTSNGKVNRVETRSLAIKRSV